MGNLNWPRGRAAVRDSGSLPRAARKIEENCKRDQSKVVSTPWMSMMTVRSEVVLAKRWEVTLRSALIIVCLALTLNGAAADSAGPAASLPVLPSPRSLVAPESWPISTDPLSIDLSRASARIDQLRKDFLALKTELAAANKIANDKERVSKLREYLRLISEYKLSIVSIDSYLTQQRDWLARERTNIWSALSEITTDRGIGPHLSVEQLKELDNTTSAELARVREEIKRARELLKALGDANGEQLQILDRLYPENPFQARVIGDRVNLIRERVDKLLSSRIEQNLKPVRNAPKNTAVDSNSTTDNASTERLADNNDTTDQPDQSYDRILVAATTLYSSLHDEGLLASKLRFVQNIHLNRKRLDDFRSIEMNVRDLRDQVAQLAGSAANMQDEINQKVEASISQIGNRDYFTLVATSIFGLAVVVVIGSFFGLAFRDRENRVLVNPDIGLQFVTLFSIIIAIILFGVLEILGGKELAALLGGISGYILGRGTLGGGAARTSGPPNSHTPQSVAGATGA
jgi:hypothetical protein